MGYHNIQIPKGELGEFSKIEEEFLEAKDANKQRAKILTLCELADLIGAIESFVSTKFNLTLNDVLKMKDLTKTSFLDGTRSDGSLPNDHIITNVSQAIATKINCDLRQAFEGSLDPEFKTLPSDSQAYIYSVLYALEVIHKIPHPYIYPTMDGNLSLEWDVRNNSISLTIFLDDQESLMYSFHTLNFISQKSLTADLERSASIDDIAKELQTHLNYNGD